MLQYNKIIYYYSPELSTGLIKIYYVRITNYLGLLNYQRLNLIDLIPFVLVVPIPLLHI
jgi:hypothetical protein